MLKTRRKRATSVIFIVPSVIHGTELESHKQSPNFAHVCHQQDQTNTDCWFQSVFVIFLAILTSKSRGAVVGCSAMSSYRVTDTQGSCVRFRNTSAPISFFFEELQVRFTWGKARTGDIFGGEPKCFGICLKKTLDDILYMEFYSNSKPQKPTNNTSTRNKNANFTHWTNLW